jgi:hypothetical protein
MLARKQAYRGQAVPDGWVVSTELRHGRATLVPGTRLTISGERGAIFRFARHVLTPAGREWIDVVGGTPGVEMTRSFRPEKISRVLRAR